MPKILKKLRNSWPHSKFTGFHKKKCNSGHAYCVWWKAFNSVCSRFIFIPIHQHRWKFDFGKLMRSSMF